MILRECCMPDGAKRVRQVLEAVAANASCPQFRREEVSRALGRLRKIRGEVNAAGCPHRKSICKERWKALLRAGARDKKKKAPTSAAAVARIDMRRPKNMLALQVQRSKDEKRTFLPPPGMTTAQLKKLRGAVPAATTSFTGRAPIAGRLHMRELGIPIYTEGGGETVGMLLQRVERCAHAHEMEEGSLEIATAAALRLDRLPPGLICLNTAINRAVAMLTAADMHGQTCKRQVLREHPVPEKCIAAAHAVHSARTVPCGL